MLQPAALLFQVDVAIDPDNALMVWLWHWGWWQRERSRQIIVARLETPSNHRPYHGADPNYGPCPQVSIRPQSWYWPDQMWPHQTREAGQGAKGGSGLLPNIGGQLWTECWALSEQPQHIMILKLLNLLTTSTNTIITASLLIQGQLAHGVRPINLLSNIRF